MGNEGTAIRQFAASWSGSVLAAAEVKGRVDLYDVVNLKHVRSIATTLDFGGHRLAITNDASTLICRSVSYVGDSSLCDAKRQ